MAFPKFRCLDLGEITLKDEDVSFLSRIQSGCANLRTLYTWVDSPHDMTNELCVSEDPEVISEALRLVDTHFRAIPSLKKIIAEIFVHDLSNRMRESMESHGWTIITRRDKQLIQCFWNPLIC